MRWRSLSELLPNNERGDKLITNFERKI